MNVQQYFHVPKNVTPSGPDPDALIMTFTLNANDSITLPTASGFSYNFIVDWGDGGPTDHITSWNQAERTHSYTGFPAGNYNVTITGTFGKFSFQTTTTSRLKITGIVQWGDVALQSVGGMFYNCSNFSSFPQSGLKLYGTDASRMFFGCSSVTYVANTFFEHFTTATTIREMFQSSGIIGIEPGLFDYFINVTDAAYVYSFRGSNITSIPLGLFDNMVSVTSFYGFFRNCQIANANTLDPDLFRYNVNLTTVGLFFTGNTLMTGVPPENLLRYNVNLNDASGMFGSTGITGIPSGFFQYNVNLQNVDSCFSGTGLTSVPSGLFDNNTELLTMQWCFNGTNLSSPTALPSGLLDNCTKLTNVSYLFRSSGLTVIPADFFKFNIKITAFTATFQSCPIATIPVDLFRYNTLVIDFRGCFNGNSAVVSIPPDIFRYNVNVTHFGSNAQGWGCFAACGNLANIPSDMFDYNPSVVDYRFVFYNCSNLSVNLSDLVAGMNFSNCNNTAQMFLNCGNITGLGQDFIDKPKGPSYVASTATSSSSYLTLANCTSLTDFATISVNYK